jgi:hypothetical protein
MFGFDLLFMNWLLPDRVLAMTNVIGQATIAEVMTIVIGVSLRCRECTRKTAVLFRGETEGARLRGRAWSRAPRR